MLNPYRCFLFYLQFLKTTIICLFLPVNNGCIVRKEIIIIVLLSQNSIIVETVKTHVLLITASHKKSSNIILLEWTLTELVNTLKYALGENFFWSFIIIIFFFFYTHDPQEKWAGNSWVLLNWSASSSIRCVGRMEYRKLNADEVKR